MFHSFLGSLISRLIEFFGKNGTILEGFYILLQNKQVSAKKILRQKFNFFYDDQNRKQLQRPNIYCGILIKNGKTCINKKWHTFKETQKVRRIMAVLDNCNQTIFQFSPILTICCLCLLHYQFLYSKLKDIFSLKRIKQYLSNSRQKK